MIPVDRASAVVRPAAIDKTYLELAHDALALEQHHLFVAEGEVRSRPEQDRAAALAFRAVQLKRAVERAGTAADTAAERFEQAVAALGPYVRRKATSSRGYVARTAALLIGDIAGLSGAAIALGEYPTLAVTQAISAGTATVTAGLAATQLRHLQQSAERQRDDAREALQPYIHLFAGPGKGQRLHTAVFVIAALIALFVTIGVFALRTAIEGSLSGLTFGALATAIALASFINSWHHADPVADLVESAKHDADVADRRHRRLASGRVVGQAEQAGAHENSVTTEYTHRGLAAAAHIEADKFRALLASPDVVGHGPGRGPSPVIKRSRSA
ncbi:hypothetical protein CG716_17420 [Mycolicibacterium sphagni]|uniref:Uncharacterized protein n=1 Tax=Mycolicibacterium sphagni TaxID=1786 RepID=A0A255DEF7_9MYCO|nr:hypothetical protein CG716_17420 [Mycolicibacterium sphagni]